MKKILHNCIPSESLINNSDSNINWSDYSDNYIVATSSNGYKVSASRSAAEFSSKFEKFNKKNITN